MHKCLNLPTFLISSFLIRVLVFGASIGDAIVMIVFGALWGGYYYLEHIKQPEVNKDIKNRISELEETLLTVKSKVNSFGLGTTLKR